MCWFILRFQGVVRFCSVSFVAAKIKEDRSCRLHIVYKVKYRSMWCPQRRQNNQTYFENILQYVSWIHQNTFIRPLSSKNKKRTTKRPRWVRRSSARFVRPSLPLGGLGFPCKILRIGSHWILRAPSRSTWAWSGAERKLNGNGRKRREKIGKKKRWEEKGCPMLQKLWLSWFFSADALSLRRCPWLSSASGRRTWSWGWWKPRKPIRRLFKRSVFAFSYTVVL